MFSNTIKKLAVFAVALLLVVGVIFAIQASYTEAMLPNRNFQDDFENNLFWFDSKRHMVHETEWSASEERFPSFQAFHDNALSSTNMAIIIGEVVGPSINRITGPARHLWEPGQRLGDNHVITPILVHYIIHMGEDITHVKVGEIFDVIEGYYYVTTETQAYFQDIPLGTVIGNRGARPMETGNRYLIFLYRSFFENTVFEYNDELPLSAAQRENSFLLDPSAPISTPRCQDAMAMYGHLYTLPPPPPAPLPQPSSPDEVTIIIQGANNADIYNSAGNKIIREGRNLYLETSQGERGELVGQRIPISQAMRRFLYILKPGEYVFDNMEFISGIPTEVTVLNFNNWSKDALVRFLDFAPSNNMALAATPTDVQFFDKVSGVEVEPCEVWRPEPPIPAHISITPKKANVVAGTSFAFGYDVYDQFGNAYEGEVFVNWDISHVQGITLNRGGIISVGSSAPLGAEVDVTVTIRGTDIYDKGLLVVVDELVPYNITIDQDAMTVPRNSHEFFTATVSDSDGQEVTVDPADITWSVTDHTGVSINQDGRLTIERYTPIGTVVTVTAIYDGAAAEVDITVGHARFVVNFTDNGTGNGGDVGIITVTNVATGAFIQSGDIVDEFTSIQVTATPSPGFRVATWGINFPVDLVTPDSVTGRPLTLTVVLQSAFEFFAEFKPI